MTTRQTVWTMAWAHVASATNCNSKDVPTVWADAALMEFDKRFPDADTNKWRDLLIECLKNNLKYSP